MPVAWPRDGLNDTAVGPQLAGQYRDEGVNMLPDHAQFLPSTDSTETRTSLTSVEAGLHEMLTRMETGRWKVFRTCQGWIREKAIYRRDKGKLVKVLDDHMDASRYGMMMLRYAKTAPIAGALRIDHDRERSWR